MNIFETKIKDVRLNQDGSYTITAFPVTERENGNGFTIITEHSKHPVYFEVSYDTILKLVSASNVSSFMPLGEHSDLVGHNVTYVPDEQAITIRLPIAGHFTENVPKHPLLKVGRLSAHVESVRMYLSSIDGNCNYIYYAKQEAFCKARDLLNNKFTYVYYSLQNLTNEPCIYVKVTLPVTAITP